MANSLGIFRDLRTANLDRLPESFHPLEEWSLTDWATAMGGECGEALNVVKKMRRISDAVAEQHPNALARNAELTADLAEEIADTVIYADLLAARAGIDLADALRAKFNAVSARVRSEVVL